MSGLEVILTAIALAMDACAVSMTNGMTAKKFKPSQAVIIALVDFFDRYYADDTGGQRLDEKQIAETVATAVERMMEERLPAFLSGYFAATEASQPLQKAAESDPSGDVIDEDDVAWDFLRGS